MRIYTYYDAPDEFINNEKLKTVIVVAFSFSKRIQNAVYKLPFEYPEYEMILLSVEELLEDGFSIESKMEKDRHQKGDVLSCFKWKKDKKISEVN